MNQNCRLGYVLKKLGSVRFFHQVTEPKIKKFRTELSQRQPKNPIFFKKRLMFMFYVGYYKIFEIYLKCST